jgi:hypothetical protein
MPKKKNGILGRPPKFSESSSALTITLPDRILQELETIDSDRAKAIVKCVEAVIAERPDRGKGYEIIAVSEDQGILLTGPSSALRSIPWVQLVEVNPARFLVSVPAGTGVAELEVAILDLLDTLPEEQAQEKALLVELRQQLALARRQEQVSSREIFLVNLSKQFAVFFPVTSLDPALLADGQQLAGLLPFFS